MSALILLYFIKDSVSVRNRPMSLSVRRRPSGLSGLPAEVPGRAPRGASGIRVDPPGAAPDGPSAHEPPAAAADRRPGRAGSPEDAPPAPRPDPQTAAGDVERQGLTTSCLRSHHVCGCLLGTLRSSTKL